MSSRARIKAWIPPALLEVRRSLLGLGLRFSDDPGGWAGACARSEGYDADMIVESVAAATREVLAGRALFERDSVLFHQQDYRYPIITAMLRAASLNGGVLEVFDFGGSLGSTYRQCRPLLSGLRQLRWWVVEQSHFVAIGRQEFSTEELSFVSSLAELPAEGFSRLALLSSVLQYLEQPDRTLADVLRLGPSHLVIDRTPMSELDGHYLCVQHVPKAVYAASYPCWILSRPKLMASLFNAGYELLADFACSEGTARSDAGLAFEFRGLLMEKPS